MKIARYTVHHIQPHHSQGADVKRVDWVHQIMLHMLWLLVGMISVDAKAFESTISLNMATDSILENKSWV